VRRELRVELVEDHPRANTHRPAVEIEIGDVPVVARKIDHQPATEGATRQPGTGAARGDLYAGVRGRGQQPRRFRRRPREAHRHRLDPVDRGVDRVEAAGEPVRSHLAARGVESSSLRITQFGHPVILTVPTAQAPRCKMQDAGCEPRANLASCILYRDWWAGKDYNPPMVFRSRRIPHDLSLNRLAAAPDR